MKIKRLVIENFKSIERIELIEPNPFTVFVGPNGSGKSNIFEALEFVNRCSKISVDEAVREFGGISKIGNQNKADIERFYFKSYFGNEKEVSEMKFAYSSITDKIQLPTQQVGILSHLTPNISEQFYLRFTRVFVNNEKLLKVIYRDDRSLNLAASNLEPVLRRILLNKVLRNEIFEWLELFVPEFKSVEVDDRDELHWFEHSSPNYFTKDLISDGTYNILALLTAVYQSDDKPQFLCIEEPENGLNPKVVKELVNLCRYACEEYGHFIWLNTHSQSLVSALTPQEIVLVDKVEGATWVKQIQNIDLHGLPMDEAWLSNALGGGLPW
jgi:predicted ATPase